MSTLTARHLASCMALLDGAGQRGGRNAQPSWYLCMALHWHVCLCLGTKIVTAYSGLGWMLPPRGWSVGELSVGQGGTETPLGSSAAGDNALLCPCPFFLGGGVSMSIGAVSVQSLSASGCKGQGQHWEVVARIESTRHCSAEM